MYELDLGLETGIKNVGMRLVHIELLNTKKLVYVDNYDDHS